MATLQIVNLDRSSDLLELSAAAQSDVAGGKNIAEILTQLSYTNGSEVRIAYFWADPSLNGVTVIQAIGPLKA